MNLVSELILHLDEIREESQRDQAGGKGYTLARMRRAGFPVPSGFVVTADAYRAFTHANGLDTVIASAMDARNPAEISSLIRVAFEEAEIPPAVVAAIRTACIAFGEASAAVRSSALAEDDVGTSFAGQHDTFLGVDGVAAVLKAVRGCWISLWSERALAYRAHLLPVSEIRHSRTSHAAMAVIVQRMVPAAYAGVAFTLDPISGRRDVVVIEAVTGVGAPMVSGRIAPQRYVVQKKDGYPEVIPDASAISPAQLAAVTRLAQETAAWAGQPQDVEWVLDTDGNVHLLQSRPITVVPSSQMMQTDAGEHRHGKVVARWTRDNVGEVLPAPVTPLSWSVLDPLGNLSFEAVLRRLGIRDHPSSGLFGRFYGRVYFNQTLFQETMSRFYPSRGGWRVLPRLATMAVRVLWLMKSLPRAGEMVISQVLEQYRSGRDLDLAVLTPDDLLVELSSWRRVEGATMEVHLGISAMAQLLYQALDKVLDRWCDGTVTATDLTVGLSGLRSAEAGQALAAVAQQVHQDSSLRGLVLASSPELLAGNLANTKEGEALLEQLEAFLLDHGHSTSQEFELAAPRWRDDWSVVLSALQAQVRVAADKETMGDPMTMRLEATERVKNQLFRPRYWFLHRLLHKTHRFIVVRENLKYHFVIAHSRLRDLYLALASRFVSAEWLADPKDIFFLTTQEVAAMVHGRLEGADGLVAERRKMWEADLKVSPPLVIDQLDDGRMYPVSSPTQQMNGYGQILRGFAASPGSFTGRARILLNPTDGADIEPGEVLVAPATNPGWAPILLAAGALVTEIGGILSHGAIIAREYGLPAVLNVDRATHRIHTGQLIRVNGSQGTVELLVSEG
jgi:pyruvate,water dikinase